MLSKLEKIRQLPHVCRSYDPWLTDHDELSNDIDPESCMVCGFGKEAHELSATLEAYEDLVIELEGPRFGERKYPPMDRESVVKKFEVSWPASGDQTEKLELYMIIGMYEDGSPCDLFFACSKTGSFAHGLLSSLAMMTSIAWQHGCPVEKTIKQWRGTQFPPRGFTGDKEFPRCGSLLDYLAQYLEARFVGA